MSRVKPVVARTPEALAEILGLSSADAKEWQVRYALLKHLKEIVRKRKITHVTPSAAAARVMVSPKGSMHWRSTTPPGCGGFFIGIVSVSVQWSPWISRPPIQAQARSEVLNFRLAPCRMCSTSTCFCFTSTR